jgi:hypothetical protein
LKLIEVIKGVGKSEGVVVDIHVVKKGELDDVV